jgi:arginine deiminase
MSDPVPLPLFFDGSVPEIFNPANFYQTQFIPSLQTTTLVSNSVSSASMQVISNEGIPKDLATQEELDELKAFLLGSSEVGASLDTIRQISDAINDDPEFYEHITSSIQGVQDNVTTVSGRVDSNDTDIATLQDDMTTAQSDITTAQTDIATLQTNQATDESAISSLQTSVTSLNQRTSAISYDTGTNTTTFADKVKVALDESLNGNIYLGDGSGNDLIYVKGNLNTNSLTVTPVQLGYLSTLSSNVQTQISSKASQSSLDTTNTNVTNLQNKTSAMAFNAGTNTLTMNEKVVVALDESLLANVTIGDSSSDILTINASISANSHTISPAMLGYLDASSSIQSQLNGKQATLTFDTTPTSSSTNPVTSGGIYTALDTTNTNVTNLQNKTSSLSYDSGTDTLSISSKVDVAKDLMGDASIYLGDASGNDIIYLRGNMSANATTITPVALSRIATLSSSAQTQLNGKQATLTFDTTPTASSTNPCTSGGIYTALGLKANDSATCHNTSNETWGGIKSFSSSPIVPTPSATDNSTKVASTAYVDGAVSTAVSNLVNGAGQAMDTLFEISAALGNDANYAATTASTIAGKASKTANNTYTGNQIYNTGTSTFNNGLTANAITLGSDDLATRLGTDETNISSNTSAITALQGKTSAMAYNATTNTLTMNEKVVVALDESLNANVTIGDAITDVLTINSTISANATNVTPTRIGYLSTLSSNVQTQLNGKQATLTFDSTPTSSSTNPCTSGGIYTALGTKQATLTFDSTPTSSSSNPCTSGGIYSALASYATLASPSLTGTPIAPTASTGDNSTQIATTAFVKAQAYATLASPSLTGTPVAPTASTGDNSTQLATTAFVKAQAYATLASPSLSGTPLTTTPSTGDDSTKIASTAFVKAQSYLTTSSASSTYAGLSSNNALTGTNSMNMVNETVNYVSGVTTALSLDYSTCKGINYIATPTANYSLAITNVPTGSTNQIYPVTLITTAKFYVNSITVNGTSRTIVAGGGASNIAINGSATQVMQQLAISFLNSSTPIVISNVISLW